MSPLTDSRDSDNDWDVFEAQLEYHKHLFDRVKHQEVRDRWFRCYLMIMASTVTVIGLALESANMVDQVVLQVFLSLLGLFLGASGILFFQIHLSQRYNGMAFLKRVQILDYGLFYPKLVGEESVSRMRKPLAPNPIAGADRNVQLFSCPPIPSYWGQASRLLRLSNYHRKRR